MTTRQQGDLGEASALEWLLSIGLATRGGNQSWSGVSKLFDTSRFDYVLVVVADGRRWFIPAAEISAKHSIAVGGASWSRFEVESGKPFGESNDLLAAAV
jgi:hypothetical protein